MEIEETKSIVELDKPKGISPQQELACHMLAIGMNQIKTAREVGVTASTVRSWAKRDDLKFLIQQIQWRIFGKSPKKRFASVIHAAIDTLTEIMTDGSMKATARISAAKEILDRGMGKAEQKHVHETGGLKEVFEKLDDLVDNQKAITMKTDDIEDVDYTEIAEQAHDEVESNSKPTEIKYDI